MLPPCDGLQYKFDTDNYYTSLRDYLQYNSQFISYLLSIIDDGYDNEIVVYSNCKAKPYTKITRR